MGHRRRFAACVGFALLTAAAPVGAQVQAQLAEPDGSAAAASAELDRTRAESFSSRRTLAWAVLGDGCIGIAAGAPLLVPTGSDLAFRFAGINMIAFGAINVAIGAYALHGIGREQARWNAPSAREARTTPEGLARARAHALVDERRESVSHALNLGLDVAYAAIGTTAIVASRAGVDHPNRWLATGIVLDVNAAVLAIVDIVGLVTSGSAHTAIADAR